MNDLISKIKESTTATQLNSKIKDKLNIVYYPDLNDVKDLDELFQDKGSFILMYMKTPSFGHWVLVSKSRNEPLTLEYFDPLGNPVDHYLDEFQYEQGAQFPGSYRLIQLMRESRYHTLLSNGVDLQKDSPDVQTCGKWCLLRHLLLFVPMQEFVDFFGSIDPNYRDIILAAVI